MQMHTYRNSFHNSSAKSTYSPTELDRAYEMGKQYGATTDAYRAGLRLKKKLCGIKGCTCSNWYGERK